jgi:MtrB/PioB family decaheme-associated outer membrane protein
MKKYNYMPAILLLPVLCASGAQAADNEVTGFVAPSVKSVHISGNKAKFSEYGDPDSGFSGGVEVKSETDTGYVTFNAEDIALDTQSYKAEAGQYGNFKLDAFYNEIQHNNTFDAKSLLSGAGTDHLSSALSGLRFATVPNPATWTNTFDYAVSRNQYGAGLKMDLLKPFFANFSVSQEDRKGLKPIGAGASSFAAELPEPVDYKTNILQAEVGYGKDPYFASLGYTHSNFENAYDTLYFTNLYAAGGSQSDFVSLPPDNSYNKFDLKGRVKMPLKSTLALGFSHSRAESDSNMYSTYNVTSTTTGLTAAHALTQADNVFNGQVDTTNYSAVLTSSPVDFLDGKIFYKNYATKNKSDEITTLDIATPWTNALFDYTKKSYGVEAGLKLPGHITLTPSYTNVETVLPEDVVTDDKIYGINAKWKGTDFVAANIGYERMNRDDNTALDTGGGANLAPYARMFDTAAQRRDTYKLGLDLFPTDMVNLGFTFKHKKIDYNETGIGLTGQRGNTYGVSGDFTPNETVSFSAYVDYDITKLAMLQRYGVTSVDNGNPVDTNPADGIFNINTDQRDKSFDWGVGVNVKAIPNTLTLRAQFDHTRSDGHVDYTYAANNVANNGIPNGWTNDTIDYANWDDYKKDSLMLKGIYSLSAHLDLTGGYAYEKYRASDGYYDNYQYVYRTSATQPGYLSGANANPDYTANVVFLSAKYKF